MILKYKTWLLPVFAVFTIRHLSKIFQTLCLFSLQTNKLPMSINDSVSGISSLFMRNSLKRCFLEKKVGALFRGAWLTALPPNLLSFNGKSDRMLPI